MKYILAFVISMLILITLTIAVAPFVGIGIGGACWFTLWYLDILVQEITDHIK